jgi:HSP20 family protein
MLIKHNPYRQYLKHEELLAPFDAMISDFLNNTGMKNIPQEFFQKGTYPKCNVFEENDTLYIEAGVPGLTKSDIRIDVSSDGILSINFNSTAKKKSYLIRELKQSSSTRSFFLNEDFDTDSIKAKVENGLLNISITRKTKTKEQPKTIRVNVE